VALLLDTVRLHIRARLLGLPPGGSRSPLCPGLHRPSRLPATPLLFHAYLCCSVPLPVWLPVRPPGLRLLLLWRLLRPWLRTARLLPLARLAGGRMQLRPAVEFLCRLSPLGGRPSGALRREAQRQHPAAATHPRSGAHAAPGPSPRNQSRQRQARSSSG